MGSIFKWFRSKPAAELPPARLWLARHGTNEYVKQGRLAGWTPDVHLSAEGAAEAEALCRRLATQTFDAIYSSPLERAKETADTIAGRQRAPVTIREALGEAHCGDWTGAEIKHLARLREWRAVRYWPSRTRFPQGESFREIQNRMVEELESLAEVHQGQNVLIVSHADPIKTALAYYLGMPLDLFQRLVIHPASISIILLGKEIVQILSINDCSHLDALNSSNKRD
jgi:probable phosphomutase (TIGR03848 family)